MFFLQLIFISAYGNDLKNETKMLIMDQSPYGYMSKNGKVTGILYEILDEILNESSIKSTAKIIPTKRLLRTMLNNDKVCTIVADTPDVTSFEKIEPIGFKVTAGILPAYGIKLYEYSNLQNLKIAVPLGIIFDERFHNDSSLKKIRPPHYTNAVKMLKVGRVDAIAGAIHMLKFIAKNEGISLHIFDKPLVMIEIDMYLFCTKSVDINLQGILKESFINLKNTGRIQVLLESYFGKSN